MKLVVLILSVRASTHAAELELSGLASRVVFGHDESNRAFLSATCEGLAAVTFMKPRSYPPLAAVTFMKPRSYPPGVLPSGNLTIELKGVPPTCLGLSASRPCARHDPEYPELFWCEFKSALGQSIMGPVAAYPYKVRDSDQDVLGVGVRADCIWPSEVEVRRITGVEAAGGAPVSVNLTVIFFAASGPDAKRLPFDGVPGGNSRAVQLHSPPSTPMPPAPPLPPSSPPPPLEPITSLWSLDTNYLNGYIQIGKTVIGHIGAVSRDGTVLGVGPVVSGFPVPSRTPRFDLQGWEDESSSGSYLLPNNAMGHVDFSGVVHLERFNTVRQGDRASAGVVPMCACAHVTHGACHSYLCGHVLARWNQVETCACLPKRRKFGQEVRIPILKTSCRTLPGSRRYTGGLLTRQQADPGARGHM